MNVVKEFPYMLLYWDEESRAVILKWRGGFAGRNLKEGLNAGLAEFKKRLPNANWIGDTSEIGVIGTDEQTWIDTTWFPAFLATGAKNMVVIQPQTAVAKMSVKGIMSKVPGTMLTVYNCASVDEGRAWLKLQKA